jgi:divalent metal cation (Fe/Co/Zn/Cd) transporter
MKAVWLEDLVSLVPPAAFIVGDHFRRKRSRPEFPYGYHAAMGIAYFAGSLALALMGLLIFLDSALKLIALEHPPIGVVELFGESVWLGWLMLPALVWSAIPAALIGRRKIELAKELHDKSLFADAEMNKADWLTAAAGIVGVLGIGLGLWWTDATAAIFISVEVIRDGARNTKAAVSDLMARRPRTVDDRAVEPIAARMENELRSLDWVQDAHVRLRSAGHVCIGDAEVVPKDERGLVDKIDQATRHLLDLDWRLHEISIVPVRQLGATER